MIKKCIKSLLPAFVILFSCGMALGEVKVFTEDITLDAGDTYTVAINMANDVKFPSSLSKHFNWWTFT